MHIVFTTDHAVVVDDDPDTGEEMEHTIPSGTVLAVESVMRIQGEDWVDVRVPGYEDFKTPVPVREELCRLVAVT